MLSRWRGCLAGIRNFIRVRLLASRWVRIFYRVRRKRHFSLLVATALLLRNFYFLKKSRKARAAQVINKYFFKYYLGKKRKDTCRTSLFLCKLRQDEQLYFFELSRGLGEPANRVQVLNISRGQSSVWSASFAVSKLYMNFFCFLHFAQKQAKRLPSFARYVSSLMLLNQAVRVQRETRGISPARRGAATGGRPPHSGLRALEERAESSGLQKAVGEDAVLGEARLIGRYTRLHPPLRHLQRAELLRGEDPLRLSAQEVEAEDSGGAASLPEFQVELHIQALTSDKGTRTGTRSSLFSARSQASRWCRSSCSSSPAAARAGSFRYTSTAKSRPS